MPAGFGVFGKIPAVADFIQFGLPVDFVQAWDPWLQAGILEAKERFGESWGDFYNSAPIWRFALPAGSAGASAMLGVLMPSVDRVGRRFPLTLAAPLPAGTSHVAALLRSGDALAGVEEIALEALDGKMSPADLEARLAGFALAEPPRVEQVAAGGARIFQREGHICAMPDLAAARLGAAGESLWCAETADASQAFAVQGLPGPELVVHLLNPFARASRSEVSA